MTRFLAIAVAAGAVIALLLTQPAAAKKPCRLKDSRLAATQGHARAYWGERLGNLVYCRTKNASRDYVVFGDAIAFPPPAVDLAGGLIGYAGSFPSGYGLAYSNFIHVKRLKGDIIYETDLRALFVSNAPGSLRITKGGGVAWIGCEDGDFSEDNDLDCPPGSYRVVYKHDATDPPEAKPELLARAKGIQIRSLRLRDDRLSWRKRGEIKRALLR